MVRGELRRGRRCIYEEVNVAGEVRCVASDMMVFAWRAQSGIRGVRGAFL